MELVPEVDQRLRKLLLYVGEEGKEFEARDVKHLCSSVESIFEKRLKLQSQITPLISLITKCIISIPNKQHLYALMTRHLTKNHEEKMDELINCVLLELQSSLNTFKQTNVYYILVYLSQLMNLDALNSFIFMSMIESILSQIKNVKQKEKMFYFNVVVKTIPYFWKSFDEKIGNDFRKMMDKIEKESTNMKGWLGDFWLAIYQQYSSKNLKDYSGVQHLKQMQEQGQLKQFNPSFRLSFKDKDQEFVYVDESKLDIEDNDNIYREYLKTVEAYLDQQNFVNIIQSYLTLKSVLYQKLKQYLIANKNPYLSKLLIETLWKEIFTRSQNQTVIFASIFISMASEPQSDLKNDLLRGIEETALTVFSIGQKLTAQETEKFANAVSLYHANVHKAWQWSSWVEQQNLVNRFVILRLIFQKISIISQFKPTPDLEPFIAKKFQPALLDSQQSMFESKILEFLNAKAQSQEIITFVSTQNQFIIFFNLLLTRMKNSLTHLTKLTERYRKVFKHFRFDRQAINCIFDFWQHSEYHKIQYFTVFLDNDMISFEKLIQAISMRAKLSDSVEKILLKRVYNKVRKNVKNQTVQQGLLQDLEQSLAL